MPRRMLQSIFDFLVDAVANFAAAVLDHPAMHKSIIDVIVQGVDQFIRQPDLDQHLMTAGHHVSKARETMAIKAGQDFPKVAGAFVKGMFRPNAGKHHKGSDENKTDNNGDNDDRESRPENRDDINNDDDADSKTSPEENEEGPESDASVHGGVALPETTPTTTPAPTKTTTTTTISKPIIVGTAKPVATTTKPPVGPLHASEPDHNKKTSPWHHPIKAIRHHNW
jgi:hypothetical protein